MKLLGWIVSFMALAALFQASIGRKPWMPSPSFFEYVAMFLVLGFGIFLTNAAQRAEQRAADQVAKETFGGSDSEGGNEPYSLFLRTFDLTGKLTIERPIRNPFGWEQFDRPGDDALERLLADAVALTAPLIGLGGRSDIELGPGLAGYIEDWRARIEQAMEGAAYIFVIPSANEGTLWEIGLIKERNYFDKTVFVMPPSIYPFKFTGEGSYKDHWEAARTACATSHQLELPPYRDEGGIFLMDGAKPVRGRAFAGFDPRSVARTINSLVQS